MAPIAIADKRFLFVIPLLLVVRPICGQKPTEPVYTSPGTPLTVGHRVTTPYNSTGSHLPIKIVPRFWHNPDSAARVMQRAAFVRLLSERTRIPKSVFLQSAQEREVSAQFFYRFVINPDGTIQAPTLIKRRFTLEESLYSPEFINALEQTTRQSIITLRFSSAAVTDTLVIPMSISIQ
jgi:hypothetical protein